MANQRDVYNLGRALLNKHGLHSWHFGFDSARTRVGITMYDSRQITVSRHYVKLNTLERIEMTIIHEIAHALVGPGHGHDAVWKAKAISLGHPGTRITSAAEGVVTVTPPAVWAGRCVNCSRRFSSNRLTAKTRTNICPNDHAGTGRIVWRRN